MPVHFIETGAEPGMDFVEQLDRVVASEVKIVKEPGILYCRKFLRREFADKPFQLLRHFFPR